MTKESKARTPSRSWGHAKGIEATVARVLEVVGSHDAYLTFDIDCLDPAFAPGHRDGTMRVRAAERAVSSAFHLYNDAMKLLRIGPKSQEKPAVLDAQGRARDLSGVVADITAAQLTPAGLDALRRVDAASLPLLPEGGRFGVPWTGCGKFIAVGLNYADHAAEANMAIPKEPVLFTKTLSCMIGCNDPVVLPRDSVKGDWEVELGIVIGSRARYVEEADALKYVAGYCVVNDVSEREYQIERSGGQWDKGKGCDTFGPVGPWMVTADEVSDPQQLGLWLELNGKRVQNGSTRTMIFGVAHLVSYISRFVTLEAGDLIITGTPPGVGMGHKPSPLFLKPGDEMRLGIDGLGEQRQRVHAWDPKLIDG
jgi:2-keto-4-pentenoate hydratase/2-oxohepta-3-ene-1,7-dioic acid hydratase in catechol pathway